MNLFDNEEVKGSHTLITTVSIHLKQDIAFSFDPVVVAKYRCGIVTVCHLEFSAKWGKEKM